MIDNNTYKDISFETTANYAAIIHVEHPNFLNDLINKCPNGTIAIDDYSGAVYMMSNNHWHRMYTKPRKVGHVPGPCF